MTKFIVVFLGVCVKLVALNIEGGYETGIGTLQWHPAIAPRPLPQSWSLPSPPSTIAHYNGTLQWQPAMALRPLPQSTPQWHPAMALRPLPQSWSSPSPPPTIAHDNGTLQWHPAMAPRPLHSAMPRPIRQSGSSPSPLLEVRTPIAIAIWELQEEQP